MSHTKSQTEAVKGDVQGNGELGERVSDSVSPTMKLSMQNMMLASVAVVFFLSMLSMILANYSRASLADIGAVVSAIVSALAFLWLIVGYRMQHQSLVSQIEELVLHRSALEKTAASNELDSFLRLYDHSIKALAYDARSIIRLYYARNDMRMQHIDESYFQGNENAYVAAISNSSEIADWISNGLAERSPIVLPDMIESYVEKYEHLQSALSKLSTQREVYQTLFSSSPSSQLYLVLKQKIAHNEVATANAEQTALDQIEDSFD